MISPLLLHFITLNCNFDNNYIIGLVGALFSLSLYVS